MENNKIKNMQKLTQEDKNQIMNQLKQNKDFQKFNNELDKKGFERQNAEFSLEENKTNLKINYKNADNNTASINAEVINGTIQNVQAENLSEDYRNYFWAWIFVLFAALAAGYFIYNKYFRLNKKGALVNPVITLEKPVDYKSEAKKLLNSAKKLFQEKKYKDAYEKAGQGLRLYLSYKYGLKKETTNEEVIRVLKGHKNIGEIKRCFDLCSLVEFAKYKANKKDFYEIIKIGEKIINKG